MRFCQKFGKVRRFFGIHMSIGFFMNNQERPPFLAFHATQRISVNVHVDREILHV